MRKLMNSWHNFLNINKLRLYTVFCVKSYLFFSGYGGIE